MKKFILFILLITTVSAWGHNIVSTSTGGSWASTSTWVGGIIPGTTDTATIAGPVTVNATRSVARLIINSGKTLSWISYSLYVYGEVINNGTVSAPSGTIIIYASNMTVLAGHGTWGGGNFAVEFSGLNMVIDSTVYWPDVGEMVLIVYPNNTTVINRGRIFFSHYWIQSGTYFGYSDTWINGKNAFLQMSNLGVRTCMASSWDTLRSTLQGDTVKYHGTSYTIKQPSKSKLYNVIFDGTPILNGNLTVSKVYDVTSGSTLNMNAYSVTLGGNWQDYGTITNNTGTATFDAIGSQCVLRTSGTENFKNMTITRTSKLGSNCTVSASGTVTVQPGGTMDCTCP